MRTPTLALFGFLAMFLTSNVASADVAPGPSCKCEVGSDSSGMKGAATACSVFGLSLILLGRKRSRTS